MKKTTILPVLILCFLCCISFAQTEYKIDEKRIYNWDGAPDWNQNTTEKYTYENGGTKETQILGQSFPGMENLYRFIKTYNDSNDIVLVVRQVWNNSSMEWEDNSQDTYTYYTGTSNIKDLTTYSFDLEYDVVRILYEYADNKITQIIFQYEDSGSLVNNEKYEYAYNSEGLPATEESFEWNPTTNMWNLIERGSATYSAGLREVITEKLNGTSWELFERLLTYYSISIEKDDEYIQQSRAGSNWVNTDREVSTYDANNNKTVYTWYSWFGSEWEPYYKEEIGYSVAEPLNTESFLKNNFRVFPNPASTEVSVSSSLPIQKMEVYNILGDKVLTSRNAKYVNIEHLTPGMYILKVYNGDRVGNQKIVIE